MFIVGSSYTLLLISHTKKIDPKYDVRVLTLILKKERLFLKQNIIDSIKYAFK